MGASSVIGVGVTLTSKLPMWPIAITITTATTSHCIMTTAV